MSGPGPEAGAAEAPAPFTREQLRDTATLESVQAQVDVLDTADPAAIHGLVRELTERGAFRAEPDTDRGPARPDPVFGERGERYLHPVGGREWGDILDGLRNQAKAVEKAAFEERLQKAWDAGTGSNGDVLARQVARAHAAGELTVSQPRPPRSGQRTSSPRNPELRTNDVNELAATRAQVAKHFLNSLNSDSKEQQEYNAVLRRELPGAEAERSRHDAQANQERQAAAAERSAAVEQQRAEAVAQAEMDRLAAEKSAAGQARQFVRKHMPATWEAYEAELKAAPRGEKDAVRARFDSVALEQADKYQQTMRDEAAAADQAKRDALAEQAKRDIHAATSEGKSEAERAAQEKLGEAMATDTNEDTFASMYPDRYLEMETKLAGMVPGANRDALAQRFDAEINTTMEGHHKVERAGYDEASQAERERLDNLANGTTAAEAQKAAEARTQADLDRVEFRADHPDIYQGFQDRLLATANKAEFDQLAAQFDAEIKEILELKRTKASGDLEAAKEERKEQARRQISGEAAEEARMAAEKAATDARFVASSPENAGLFRQYQDAILNAPDDLTRQHLQYRIDDIVYKFEADRLARPEELLAEAARNDPANWKAEADQDDAIMDSWYLDPKSPTYLTPDIRFAAAAPLNKDLAHEYALRLNKDLSIQRQAEITESYSQLIKEAVANGNQALATKLGVDRDAAARATKQRYEAVVGEVSGDTAKVLEALHKHEDVALRMESSNNQTSEDKALMRHNALAMEPVPFLINTHGGLLHMRGKNRGPRIVESYFRSAQNANVIMVDRRMRNDGRLVSQTVFANKESLKSVGRDNFLPPNGFRKRMQEVREADATHSKTSAKGRDYVGFGSEGGSFTDTGGVYDRYGATPTARDTYKKKRRRTAKRRPSVWWRV